MLPGKYFPYKVRVEQPPINEQLEDPPPEYVDERRGVFDRNVMERARLVNSTF